MDEAIEILNELDAVVKQQVDEFKAVSDSILAIDLEIFKLEPPTDHELQYTPILQFDTPETRFEEYIFFETEIENLNAVIKEHREKIEHNRGILKERQEYLSNLKKS